jgi:hypothetical protein
MGPLFTERCVWVVLKPSQSRLESAGMVAGPSWARLPPEDAAKKATASPGITAIATSTAATAAIARHDIGVEAVVTVAAVTVAAGVTVIVAGTIATTAHFDSGAGGLDRFGSACGNGKGIS